MASGDVFRPALVAAALMAGSGCQAQAVTATTQAVLCPELSGNADLLRLSYSSDAAADARIRTFVSSVRGLYDATLEMERLVADTCRRVDRDLGAPPLPADASLETLCAPIPSAVRRLAERGIEIRISVAAPRCSVDGEREAQCSFVCGGTGHDDECAPLCKAQSALYGRCTLPSITVAASSGGEDVTALARTLEQNLPELVYAEMALGQRLAEHARVIVATAGHLPSDVKESGQRGVACVALAATLAARAAERLAAVVAVSERATAALRPEIHSSTEGAP